MRRKREGQEASDAQRVYEVGYPVKIEPAFSYRIEENATGWIQLL